MKYRVDVWAILIVLLAASLRFSGLSFGQPIPEYAPQDVALNTIHENTPLHPDEFLFIQRPLRMLLTGELNPKFFHNPSFLINTNLAVFALTGEQQHLSWEGREEIGARRAAPFRLYINGRTFSALGGILAVAATYGAARFLTHRQGARLAALVVALSLPMVQHAHYTTTSSLSAGFVMLTIWASFASLSRFRWWMFALAGIAAGLAAGSRYNAAAVSLIVFFAGWILLYRERTVSRAGWVLLGWILFPLTFIFTTPHVIFDTAFFLEEFRFITNQYVGNEQNVLNVSPWLGLFHEYRYLIGFGIGWGGAVVALIGFLRVASQRKMNPLFILLLVYLIPYSYVVLRTIRPIGADQMLVPIIPVFALLIGIGAYHLNRYHWLLWGVILIPLAWPTAQVVYQFNQTDTRYIMQQWIFENVPQGATIHLDGPYNVPLDATLYNVSQTYGTGEFRTLEELINAGVEYVIVSDAWFRHFERALYVDRDEVERVTTHIQAYDDQAQSLFTLPRPQISGYHDPMHTASYWHHPALTLYCLTDTACAPIR